MKIGNNTILLGDSIELIRRFPDHSFDGIIGDPPYSVPTCAAAGGRRQRNKLGSHQADAALRTVGDLSMFELAMHSLFVEFRRILRPSGRLFLFSDDRSCAAVLRAGYGMFKRSRLLIWDKCSFGMGQEFRRQYELIYSACCDECPMATDENGKPICDQADILRHKPVPSARRHHPAEKPTELIENLLRFCTTGGRILDPFMGSGTTMAACAAKGFRGIGIEIDPEIYRVAAARLQAEMSEAKGCS